MILTIFLTIICSFGIALFAAATFAASKDIRYWKHLEKIGKLAEDVSNSRAERLKLVASDISVQTIEQTLVTNCFTDYLNKEMAELDEILALKKSGDINSFTKGLVLKMFNVDLNKVERTLVEKAVKEEEDFKFVINSLQGNL